jgi:hypothetical protein
MTIQLTVILTNSGGGVLDRTELEFYDRTYYANGGRDVMQRQIHSAIAQWNLRPGDTIQIRGDEEAFDHL